MEKKIEEICKGELFALEINKHRYCTKSEKEKCNYQSQFFYYQFKTEFEVKYRECIYGTN